MLRSQGVTHLVFTGITTDVCVHTTMREANDRGYECLLLEDCTGATEYGNYLAALEMVKMQGGVFGAVASSAAFLLALMGGLWLPVENMPSLMRTIAHYTPTYWAVQVAHNPLFHTTIDGKAIVVLLAWAVGLGIIGIRRFQADTARA